MRSHALTEFSDWFHQTRDMLACAALLIAGVIGLLWWNGVYWSTPLRAAEAAVRETVADRNAILDGSRMHAWTGHREWLVCGAVEGQPRRPFAVLVQNRRPRSPLSLLGTPNRAEITAVSGLGNATSVQIALLEACAARA